uniref:Tlr 2Fp protein n=1 Tax=Tetrahymena thermophila TaxID=5911 RepID=Q8WRB7_TETTH|nr:Tlr 2Fp protein [Tetrahymena thermophila]
MMDELVEGKNNHQQKKQVENLQKELDEIKRRDDKNKLFIFETKLQNIINRRKRLALRKIDKVQKKIEQDDKQIQARIDSPPRNIFQKTANFITKKIRSISTEKFDEGRLQQLDLKNKEKQIAQLKSQITHNEDHILHLQRDINKLMNENQIKDHYSIKEKKQLKEYETKFNDAISERNQMQRELANLEQSLRNERTQNIRQRNFFDEQLKQEQQKRIETDTENQNLKTQIRRNTEELEQKQKVMNEKLTSNKSVINQLRNEVMDRDVRMQTLYNQIQELRSQQKMIQAQSFLRERVILENHKDSVAAQLSDELNQMKNKYENNEQEKQTLNGRIVELNRQIEQLRYDVGNRERSQNLLVQDNQNINRRIVELDRTILEKDQRIEQLERQLQQQQQPQQQPQQPQQQPQQQQPQPQQQVQVANNLQLQQKKDKVNSAVKLKGWAFMYEPYLGDFLQRLRDKNVDVLTLTEQQILDEIGHYERFLEQNNDIYQRLKDQFANEQPQQQSISPRQQVVQPPQQNVQPPQQSNQQRQQSISPRQPPQQSISPRQPIVQQPPQQLNQQRQQSVSPRQPVIQPAVQPVVPPVQPQQQNAQDVADHFKQVQDSVNQIFKYTKQKADSYYPDVLIKYLRQFQPNIPRQVQAMNNFIFRAQQFEKTVTNYQQNRLNLFLALLAEIRSYLEGQGYQKSGR